jgi:hypothetical protein
LAANLTDDGVRLQRCGCVPQIVSLDELSVCGRSADWSVPLTGQLVNCGARPQTRQSDGPGNERYAEKSDVADRVCQMLEGVRQRVGWPFES